MTWCGYKIYWLRLYVYLLKTWWEHACNCRMNLLIYCLRKLCRQWKYKVLLFDHYVTPTSPQKKKKTVLKTDRSQCSSGGAEKASPTHGSLSGPLHQPCTAGPGKVGADSIFCLWLVKQLCRYQITPQSGSETWISASLTRVWCIFPESGLPSLNISAYIGIYKPTWVLTRGIMW